VDVHIPKPNEGLADWLDGPDCRRVMEEISNTAGMLAQADIHRRTGALAASVNSHVNLGGHHNDRWVAEVTIGGMGSKGTVNYGASYEFGADVVANGQRYENANPAHHVADQVLGELENY
jgi:hypothetical protein